MSKYTLNTIGSISLNPTTATNTINVNNATVQVALDDTLSRSGLSPNAMESNIDMNSNRILNLPQGLSAGEPLRVQDLNSFVNNGKITFSGLPTGGTAGQTLKKNSSTDFDASWKNDTRIIGTDYGMDPSGVTNSAPGFRAAIAATPQGGTLYVPTGTYLMNDQVNGAVAEIFNKSIAIIGEGWRVVYNGTTWSATGTVFQLGSAILSTTDFIHVTGPSTGTVGAIGGMHFADFCITTTAGIYAGAFGRHGIYFDALNNDNFFVQNALIENLFIDNMATGYSIYANANITSSNGSLMLSNIRRNFLMSIRLINVGDAITVGPNNAFGQNATNDIRNQGFYLAAVTGATSHRVLNNYFLNFNGMVVVDQAPAVLIEGNVFEQSAASTYNKMVDINGNTSIITGANVRGNRFSQNVAAGGIIPLNINKARNTGVDNNWFFNNNTNSFITVTVNATSTIITGSNYYQDSSGYKSNGNYVDGGTATKYETPTYTQQAATNVPGTPNPGVEYAWYDVTDKRFHDIASDGTIGTTVIAKTATANQFVTAISTAGVVSQRQPIIADVSGFGTGVAPALGVNVGTAGSFVVNGGALGTPSSGTATNLTGTASGLTAGTVTTNANLTGPITSVGNATSVASQTGTGSKFVMDTSPTLVTPTLGVATATTINGAAIDNNAWNPYTPTFSAGSGSFATGGSAPVASGRYKQIGKTVWFTAKLVVGAAGVGTAATSTIISLPVTASQTTGCYPTGRENQTSGSLLSGWQQTSTTNVTFTTNASGFASGNNTTCEIAGTYEAA